MGGLKFCGLAFAFDGVGTISFFLQRLLDIEYPLGSTQFLDRDNMCCFCVVDHFDVTDAFYTVNCLRHAQGAARASSHPRDLEVDFAPLLVWSGRRFFALGDNRGD